jgi:aldose 1-epimerase
MLESRQLRVCVTDFGARIVSIEAPDREGAFGHVLLGFENAEAYLEAGGSFGAILGRYANRIDGGRFTLDGKAYQLAVNDAGGTLHGGPRGFANALWRVENFDADAAELAMTLVSPDGDQGFPGTLSVTVTYRLRGCALQIALSATTDRPTIVNLSSHPYFNLAGVSEGDCLSHEIAIDAEDFLVTNSWQIPTGERRRVEGSGFDFRAPKRLGADIRRADEQLIIGRGYDHCFVLNHRGAAERRAAAMVYEERSGRMLKVFTDQPGLQLYSGNSLDGSVAGRDGMMFRQSAGFALEAENFPDAPNHSEFPSSVLRPGEVYRRMIRYEF